jgi:hypothetical protein
LRTEEDDDGREGDGCDGDDHGEGPGEE